MKTIQMTIEEDLLSQVDQVTEELETSRSAFIRNALRYAIRKHEIEKLERQHEEGYRQIPISPDEFGDLMELQTWGDE